MEFKIGQLVRSTASDRPAGEVGTVEEVEGKLIWVLMDGFLEPFVASELELVEAEQQQTA